MSAAGGHDPTAALRELAVRFTDAFNRGDLDAVMAMFAADSVYDEVNGARSRGKAAIRAAFEPQFRGDYGEIRFELEDVFADAVAGKALVRWECRLERDGKRRSWHGLDVLHFRGGLVVEKHTYGKAERVRATPSDAEGGETR